MRNGRLWVVLLGLLIAIPAAIVAVNTLIGQILQEVHIERQVQIQLKTAQHYQDVDDFDNALREIDKALELRPKDESIIIKQVELRTYKLAAEYDQRKLLPPREVLEDLERNCYRLHNASENEARITALCGIVRELHDRPLEAIENFYKPAANNGATSANVLNYWGYTIYKWEIGDKHWQDDALEKFREAQKRNPRYAWPYINEAMIHLIRQDPENAKKPLDQATERLPTNPRVHMLWGEYYTQIANRLKSRTLPESTNYYNQAVDHFEKAKNSAPFLPDAHLDLGLAYEAIGRNDDALHEYEEATRLDHWNLDACKEFARILLVRVGTKRARPEFARCAKLSSAIAADYSTRFHQTTDMAAHEWLTYEIKEYLERKKVLRAVMKQLSTSKKKAPTWTHSGRRL